MRAVAVAVAVLAAAALAGGVVLEWARGPDPLSDDEAAVFAATALADLGFRGVQVDPAVLPTTYEGAAAWDVRARVDGGSVRLVVHEEAGEAVFVEDVADDGGPLLTDEQFTELDAADAGLDAAHRSDAWVVTIAGVAGAAVAATVAGAVARR